METDLDEKYEKMLNSGEIYDCNDKELFSYQQSLVEKLNQFNKTPATEEGFKEREKILKEIMGEYSPNVYFEPPVRSNWGLHHVFVKEDVYFNSNADLVDDANIYINSHCMFGPNVTIVTALHPISPKLRRYKLEYNKPVTIGENVWVGANVTILPGVTIGDNSVIGAGSVVTKDIPSNVIAFGNPCKIHRKINEEDDIYYDHDKKISKEILEHYK